MPSVRPAVNWNSGTMPSVNWNSRLSPNVNWNSRLREQVNWNSDIDAQVNWNSSDDVRVDFGMGIFADGDGWGRTIDIRFANLEELISDIRDELQQFEDSVIGGTDGGGNGGTESGNGATIVINPGPNGEITKDSIVIVKN